jgi:signal transduction histidine kinase/CheY-like chemotaxis protein
MHGALLKAAFWKLFIILLIIAGVAAWLFVLAQESRRVAQEESIRQTNLLMREIEAHKITDAQLQKAKEVAEAANLAKSRYVVGISHELRTPLNAILGYAQLLEHDEAIPPHRRNAIRHVRRSAEHLSGLIDGLLDISRIEAGRLRLNRDEVRIGEFLDQLVDMFRLQSAAKGIDFSFRRLTPLPALVYTDEKRLRQILINLLSNAIKFTEQGQVSLVVRYRNQVAEIDVEDTGVGILPQDQQRIFEPFERAERPRGPAIPGTGLGLTITKMLTEVMGGEISLTSEFGKGSRFRVRLMLSAVARSQLSRPSETRVTGYRGARRTVLIADDEPSHRDLLHEILAPLGFILLSARDGTECIELAADSRPDLFLLDIAMPDADGWAVARHLRETGHERAAIIMISANAGDDRGGPTADTFHNDYLIKPIIITQLLGKIGAWLQLEWTDDSPAETPRSPLATLLPSQLPARHHVEELLYLGRIGYVRGIHMKLDEIANKNAAHAPFVSHLRFHVLDFDMNQYMSALEALPRHDA